MGATAAISRPFFFKYRQKIFQASVGGWQFVRGRALVGPPILAASLPPWQACPCGLSLAGFLLLSAPAADLDFAFVSCGLQPGHKQAAAGRPALEFSGMALGCSRNPRLPTVLAAGIPFVSRKVAILSGLDTGLFPLTILFNSPAW